MNSEGDIFMNKRIYLNSFLKLGYNLDYTNKKYEFDFNDIDKSLYKNVSEEKLIEIGEKKLLKAIHNNFDNNRNNVVPLSGGLDSRAILAGLLRFTEARNIKTYTFGIPNSWDYDIGNNIALRLGTDHNKINLNFHKYKLDELIETSKKFDYQTILFYHPSISELYKLYGEDYIWSGFMGDPLSGGHLSKNNYNSISRMKNNFLIKNTFSKSLDLCKIDDKAFFPYIKCLSIDPNKLTLKEQYDFKNRQLKYIAPHVLMKDFNYKTPFLESEWVKFILSVPNNLRFNQYLFKKILLKAFPYAFDFPTKTSAGLKLDSNKLLIKGSRAINKGKRLFNKIHPFFVDKNLNYLNFNNEIRKRNNLKELIRELLHDLNNRKILEHININNIYEKHVKNVHNYANSIIILSSLEINLKAMEKCNDS